MRRRSGTSGLRAQPSRAHVALWLLDATQPLKASERAVLSELAARGLPLLVLVNKLDRLQASSGDDPGALEATLAHVRQGLAEAGLEPLEPPIAFSARLALAGRSGDPEQLERSNWAEVEALVERVLVEQSAGLRERTLRRRAADVVQLRGGERAGELAGPGRTAQAARRRLRVASRARAELRDGYARWRAWFQLLEGGSRRRAGFRGSPIPQLVLRFPAVRAALRRSSPGAAELASEMTTPATLAGV
jgi:hypothetical protein